MLNQNDYEEYRESLDRLFGDSDSGKFVPPLVAVGAFLNNKTVDFEDYFKMQEQARRWRGSDRRRKE